MRRSMVNTMSCKSEALVGGTIVKARVFEAAGIDEAKRETRAWLASLDLSSHVTQLVIRMGEHVAWASPLPERT